jgi:hypothetical protein
MGLIELERRLLDGFQEQPMDTEPSFKTAVCSEYEKLLFACQKALESWRDGKDKVASQGFVSKQTSDELLRLQANYARAYSRLESHDGQCELCRFVAKIGGRELLRKTSEWRTA